MHLRLLVANTMYLFNSHEPFVYQHDRLVLPPFNVKAGEIASLIFTIPDLLRGHVAFTIHRFAGKVMDDQGVERDVLPRYSQQGKYLVLGQHEGNPDEHVCLQQTIQCAGRYVVQSDLREGIFRRELPMFIELFIASYARDTTPTALLLAVNP